MLKNFGIIVVVSTGNSDPVEAFQLKHKDRPDWLEEVGPDRHVYRLQPAHQSTGPNNTLLRVWQMKRV